MCVGAVLQQGLGLRTSDVSMLGVAELFEDERMHAFLSTLELDMSDAKKIFHILASEQLLCRSGRSFPV